MSYILLTGATGMLGAVILEQLLQDGHNVNAVVRSLVKSKGPISGRHGSAVQSGQLIFSEISDMTVPECFDNISQGASVIIHAVTPLGRHDFLETVIKPASLITFNILSAAAKSTTVKRLIITGSLVSTVKFPEGLFSGKVISERDFNNCTLEEATQNLPNAYSYSKVNSEKEAWTFIEEKKPNFDLVYLLAPSIIGKNIQPNFIAMKNFLGGVPGIYRDIFDQDKPGNIFPYYMSVHIFTRAKYMVELIKQ
jgi:NADPH-dependent methylglyoxal reductase